MTFIEKLRGLWRNLIGLPQMIRTLFGPPPFDGYPENLTDPGVPYIDRRDPIENPIEGDVFKGPHGGVRHFRGFNLETNEAEFTRADRPSLCREPRAKWVAWAKNATLISKVESR